MKVLPFLVGSTIAFNVINQDDEIDVFKNTNIGDIEETFLDSIYGELVETEDSLIYKQQLISNGEISINSKDQSDTLENTLENLLKARDYLTLLETLEKSSKEKIAVKAHEGYKKYKNTINYPDKDDTSDLNDQSMFGGIITFGHFGHFNCFDPKLYSREIDIAIVGAPFDTGVSYRPGARFGPEAIRLTSRRLGVGRTPVRGNGKPDSKLINIDPYNTNLSIVDCGDVPLTPFDNRIALNQLYRGIRAIHQHDNAEEEESNVKVITMGGDHTITLMALKSAFERYGKLSVLHFDSHIDTWNPKVLGGEITSYMSLNHGTFLHYAAENGYLNTSTCMHLGLRAPYIKPEYDIDHDRKCGFETITARDFDNLGREEIISRVKERVGDLPVYISVDIDVLDPSAAPGTGTMEVGGWTTRELLSILDGLEGINLIGADVVEVSPPFDTNSEITSLAATAVIDSYLGLMMVNGL